MVVTLQEAQANLRELIRDQPAGQEVEITDNGRSIAKLVILPEKGRAPKFGTLKGTVLSMEGFDDPLDDFKEYM